jgi:hypothetical protein
MSKKRETAKDFQFIPECYTFRFTVFPTIAMIRDNALKLATKFSEHTELTDIHMADESWVFQRPQARQGQPRGRIRVTIDDDSEISIEHRYPAGGLERFDMLVEKIIQSLGSVVSPDVVFSSAAILEYVVDIGGDARKILLGSLGLAGEEMNKMSAFKRPCHSVGLRLGFPPYILKEAEAESAEPEETSSAIESSPDADDDDEDDDDGSFEELTQPEDEPDEQVSKSSGTKGASWHSTLTLESVAEEPNRLSVEVDGKWFGAVRWKKFVKLSAERLRTVDDFMRQQTTEFLQHFRNET